MKHYYVYIMTNHSKTLYVGMTSGVAFGNISRN
jgi:predicted GIY-YIG superfamily endonuclease